MDKKISDLGSVSVPTSTDIVPIVYNGDTMQVSLGTLFSKIPGNVAYAGIMAHNGTPQTVGAPGAIDLTSEYTYLSNQSGSSMAVTLANGTHGQVKTLVCIAATSSTVMTATQSNFTNATFTAVGQTLTLKYLTDKWYIISAYGVTIN